MEVTLRRARLLNLDYGSSMKQHRTSSRQQEEPVTSSLDGLPPELLQYILGKLDDCEDVVRLCASRKGDAATTHWCDAHQGEGTIWYRVALQLQDKAAALWRPFHTGWDEKYGPDRSTRALGRRIMLSPWSSLSISGTPGHWPGHGHSGFGHSLIFEELSKDMTRKDFVKRCRLFSAATRLINDLTRLGDYMNTRGWATLDEIVQEVHFEITRDTEDREYSLHCHCYRGLGSVRLNFAFEDKLAMVTRRVFVNDYQSFVHLNSKPYFVTVLHEVVEMLSASGVRAFRETYRKQGDVAYILIPEGWRQLAHR